MDLFEQFFFRSPIWEALVKLCQQALSFPLSHNTTISFLGNTDNGFTIAVYAFTFGPITWWAGCWDEIFRHKKKLEET